MSNKERRDNNIMKNNIKELFKKYKEIINYLIIGVSTTTINYISFVLLTKLYNIDIHTSNIIAWVISVIFAYFTNKLFVFQSKSFKTEVIVKEMLSFAAARVFSLLLEEAMLYIFVNILNMNELIIKLIANIVVIIVNYILSKLFIFKNIKEEK